METKTLPTSVFLGAAPTEVAKSLFAMRSLPALLAEAEQLPVARSDQQFAATDQPQAELRVTLVLAIALIANIVLLAPFSLTAIAWGYLAVSCAVMLLGSRPAIAEAFGPSFVRL